MGLIYPLLLLGYVTMAVVGLWLVFRFVRAVEQMGRTMEDVAVTMKKDRV